MPTKIEWVNNPDGTKGETWNPIRVYSPVPARLFGYHCTKVSPGCDHCYAERMNNRFGNGKPFDAEPTTFGLDYSKLEFPYHWKKPRRVFVQSMGDLFHNQINREQIRHVFKVMQECKNHTFILLTKRPRNMIRVLKALEIKKLPGNVWAGVTVESNDQRNRVLDLIKVPAAVRFISVEPMLGPLNMSAWMFKNIHWVIAGGETGPGSRPINPGWVLELQDQVEKFNIPFFFKSWGDWTPIQYINGKLKLLNLILEKNEVIASYNNKYCNMKRVGKKNSGRSLNGVEYSEMPKGVK